MIVPLSLGDCLERAETVYGEFIQICGLTETAPLLTINRAPAEWTG